MPDRLSREDWIAAGLAAIGEDGGASLKADVLAKRLGVSRGSFYWHFADLSAFQAAVVEAWQDRVVEAIIRALEKRETGVRLRVLVCLAFHADAALEIGMRAWAASAPCARDAVTAVDTRRLAYLEHLLRSVGVAAEAAEIRARVLYWTYLGHALSRAEADEDFLERLVEELVTVAGRGTTADRDI